MEHKTGGLLGMPRNLTIVVLALFTWGIGEGMFWYLQPVYLQTFGAQPVEIGAVLSLVGVVMAVAQAPAGAISDRIGARPVMRSAWVVGLLATVLMALAGSLTVFIAGMLLYGLTSYVGAPLSSYQTQARGSWSVERSITIPGALYNLGTFLGALSGGWIGDQLGLQNVYRIACLLFLVSTLVIFQASNLRAEEHSNPQARQHPSLGANPRFLWLLGVVVFSTFALYLPQPLTSLYLTNQHGFSVQGIGTIAAVAYLSNAAIMLVLGGVLRARTGMPAGILMVAVFVLLMWAGSQAWMFYLGFFFLGGFRLFRAMATAQARAAVRANQVGLAFGLLETGNAVAVILAPLLAGLLYDRDPRSMYLVSLAAIGLALFITVLQNNASHRQVDEAAPGSPTKIDQD